MRTRAYKASYLEPSCDVQRKRWHSSWAWCLSPRSFYQSILQLKPAMKYHHWLQSMEVCVSERKSIFFLCSVLDTANISVYSCLGKGIMAYRIHPPWADGENCWFNIFFHESNNKMSWRCCRDKKSSHNTRYCGKFRVIRKLYRTFFGNSDGRPNSLELLFHPHWLYST